jgi:hypothetical protein
MIERDPTAGRSAPNPCPQMAKRGRASARRGAYAACLCRPGRQKGFPRRMTAHQFPQAL